MTATEHLRALLDERGVEWKGGRNHANYTSWDASDWRMSAEELADGTLFMRAYSVKHLSPEQAVEATLGRGTCKRVFYEPTGVYVCSECGCGLSKKLDKYCYLHYCPNCGRMVV